MRRLELSPGDIDIIVLSHGHWDHTTGMDGLVAGARPRERARPDPSRVLEPPPASRCRAASRSSCPPRARARSRARASRSSSSSSPRSCSTGRCWSPARSTARPSSSRASPIHEAYRRRRWQPDPLILDDQALVANVRGRGLVVLTGCGHSGIVNILRYVRKLTGEDRIHAVIGGFHLSGPLFEKVIAPTCDALADVLARPPRPLRTARAGAPRTRSPPGSPRRSSRTASARGSSSHRLVGDAPRRRRRDGRRRAGARRLR